MLKVIQRVQSQTQPEVTMILSGSFGMKGDTDGSENVIFWQNTNVSFSTHSIIKYRLQRHEINSSLAEMHYLLKMRQSRVKRIRLGRFDDMELVWKEKN